jgi:tripartite-type tricarboxylate transporter receptor subunit TctC
MKVQQTLGTLAAVLTAALAAAVPLAAHGQAADYPNRPVKMLVPFPPGSATDLAARVMGQQLQNTLGKPFIVENRPGAQGTIAGNEVVRAAPDGHTLLFTSNTAVASNVPLMKKMPYDPAKDFAPVAGVGDNSLVLMVKPDFPAKDLKEFIAYAKQRPGKLAAITRTTNPISRPGTPLLLPSDRPRFLPRTARLRPRSS